MDSLKDLCERLEALERHVRRAEQRARAWRNIACCLIVVALVGLPVPTSTARENSSSKENRGLAHRLEKLEDILERLVRRFKAIEHKLMHITSTPDEVVITGANLRIVNGLGDTLTANGLGNLIVGYNESREPFERDVRTGSQNVIVGGFHNFSSVAGLVVGGRNEISNFAASVVGGVLNTASGDGATVIGGNQNIASGSSALVSGGGGNTASGNFSSVSGGIRNTASGPFGSVSGGDGNMASGFADSVSGGRNNIASGNFSSVSGGLQRTAPGTNNWAAGPLFADN
jgi:hypothetical protein